MIKTANNRKPISKKMRFEVFKRDRFTCQYCGRMAPDVVLEVDHITPVSEGGTNDILNLVTSCKECNRGKGAIKLDDQSEVKKQQAMIKELAEKNEQLTMMLEWRNGISKLEDREVDALLEYAKDTYGCIINENGKKKVRLWVKKYSFDDLVSAMDEAFGNPFYTFEESFQNIPKYAYYRKNPISEDAKQILYLRKILINRLSYVDKTRAYGLIEKALYQYNVPYDEVKRICCTCRSWTSFTESLEEIME